MPFPKNWTEEDEKKALEGLDVNKDDGSNFYTFGDFRTQLVEEGGWTGNREETLLMYAIFEILYGEPGIMADIAAMDYSTVEGRHEIFDKVLGHAKNTNAENEAPESYALVMSAYEKNKVLYDARMAEKAKKQRKNRRGSGNLTRV